ncbi:ATP-binding cassette sub-family C member 4-like [Lutzomyia longipalpis]|uniref:ATP-binding cassette sub-family C member 4-like n=1 Tax=Lutzomyia longipalpis TaxID=7200 RepID=UPI0024838EA4|nr:ATP-binding cassette sub-family C member 4-like [Lutzomyia longipalpis]XP_055676612.1 ATP-binding cassette sub-family C member 4-like [Lutzomyia longipalpis]XP_055676613.1 ATP-binding cassette sub-family C member 4-like [Lutzomyia longipalpis]
MEAAQRTLLPNPREKANVVSILTFWWTMKLFKKGYRKVLDLGDLYRPLDEDRSNVLGDRLEKKWMEQLKRSKSNPSLIKAVAIAFWKEYLLLALIVIVNEAAIRLGQPLLLGRLLLYFRPNSGMTHTEALLYAGGIVGLSLLYGVTGNQFLFTSFYCGMKIRVAMCSIIYRKALKLSRTALGDTAPGKVVNLLSNDVNRFDLVSILVHMMWASPLMAMIVGYLLWLEAGWAGFVGIMIVFTVVPLQSYTGKLSSRFRLQAALRTDERVRFMDEIISGVQVIKMYAWEAPFAKLITVARKLELKIIRRSAFVRAIYMTFLLFTTRMALFCTMLTMVLMDHEITAAKVFVIMAYFNILAYTMSQMFVRGVAEIAEVLVALKRLRKFLMYEERDEPNRKQRIVKDMKNGGPPDIARIHSSYDDPSRKYLVSLKNATAKWQMPERPVDKKSSSQKEKEASEGYSGGSVEFVAPTLDNICLDCKKGSLIGIVGPVGAGKSSLLQVILKELPLESGTMQTHGSLSYAGQEPWVFAASIRQNILFGEDFHKERYDAVIKACALNHDLEQFPNGDQTIIGERGASLSGGQRARVSLARAVYRRADIYLFDDPLSAVDAHVGRHLFDQVIGPKGRLSSNRITRILVTHQVHFLKDADWLVVLKDGQIEIQGPPLDVFHSGIDFAKLLNADDDDAEDGKSENPKFRRQQSTSSSRSQSSRNSLSSEDELDDMIDEKKEKENQPAMVALEGTSKGTVKGPIFINYLKAGGNWAVLSIMFVLFLITQFMASGFDWFIAYWTSQEELRDLYNVTLDAQEFILTNKTLQIVDSEVPYLLSTETCLYIAGGMVISLFLFGLIRSLGFYSMCIKASQRLHDGMFNGIISTTMRFFDTNPSGRILNRFSKDLGATDEQLPKAILDATQIILNMLGYIVVATTVNPLFLAPILGLTVMFLFIRKVYLKTSKNIKRLDGITRSPVFTHLGASLMGLPTIRAFGAQEILVKEFDALQDTHTASWYMFIGSSGAFGYVMDLLCVAFIFFVTFSFLLIDTDAMGDQVGLAISQAMALTGFLQWGIRQSAEVANQLMSVERVMEYRDLVSEKQPEKPQEVSAEWPETGKLEMKDVRYRYFKEADPVLKGVNLSIKAKEKIGIVGRTGAGKSSLIGTLFRLAEVEGDIEIDGVKTDKIALQKLRSKVSIIPQDPVLFSGTLRRNLDPFEEYKDAALWQSLEEVELKDIASGPLALQAEVLAGGSNYSVGQRQLICLARAILRNNKILVLDEATANVDPNTDALIQQTIRTRFADCTVLTVAHRLHTIMDSDRVLVMSDGLVGEFDAPHLLLQRPKGLLREMVNSTGPQESERLMKIAKDAFESNFKEYL